MAGPVSGTFYVVGGAVRDALLGRPSNDRDWVVVGSTPEALAAAGYKPVGKDFPVFLDPRTGEEVALARTERKSAPGYHGFSFHADPSVTLEDDLARREARQAQQAHRVFGERGRDVAQHACFEVAAAAEGVDDAAVGGLRHRVDGQIAAHHVV